MTDDNPFQVIRDAIFNANINHPEAGLMGDQVRESHADHYARAVLIALERLGFNIVRHVPEPDDD